MTTVNIISCGGAGINIAHSILPELSKRLKGVVELKSYALDTSNVNSHKVSGDFLNIQSKTVDAEALTGSGAERNTNATHIGPAVTQWVESKGFLDYTPKVVNIVIHSLAGGSGSVIGPMLVKTLMSQSIPVFVVAVGSTDDLMSVQNTEKTLETYHVISSQLFKKPLTMAYYNNSEIGMYEANSDIGGIILALAVMTSGKNESLDETDMRNYVDPSNYNKIQVPIGIGFAHVEVNDVVDKLRTLENVTIARVLSKEYVDIGGAALHTKNGVIIEGAVEEAVADIGDPIGIYTLSGALKPTMEKLRKIRESLIVSIEDNEIDVTGDVSDGGMVF